MDQPADHIAGFKHRCTPACERFLKEKVMDMCQARNLYQVDLLNPSRVRVTEKEYFIHHKGLDQSGDGFASRKDFIRDAIERCAVAAGNSDEFKMLMESRFEITVKESRGRYSYIIPGRERGITDRQLGMDYRKNFLEKVITGQVEFRGKQISNVYVRSDIGKMVDITSNEKAQNSAGYEFALKKINVKRLSESLAYLSEQKTDSLVQIAEKERELSELFDDATDKLREIEKELQQVRERFRSLEEYRRTKPIVEELKSRTKSEAYRSLHESDLILFKAASKALHEAYPDGKLPSKKSMQTELDALTKTKNELYEQRSRIKKDIVDLQNAKRNVETVAKERIPAKESRDEPEL